MSAAIKLGNVILCEHIVEGKNNKHTLINVYSGDILMSEFPGHIPVAFYIELLPGPPISSHVEIKLMLGKKQVMRGGADISISAINTSVMAIPMGLLMIESPTALRLMVTADGAKPLKALEKKISLVGATPA